MVSADSPSAYRDIAAFAKVYQQIITSVTSYYDGKENAYHMLLLGMCVYLPGRYEIRSNLETGHGRCCDILLKAKNPKDSHIIIELKQREDLSLLANQALWQMKDNQYYSGVRGDAILMGIAHDKKRSEIVWEVLEFFSEMTFDTISLPYPYKFKGMRSSLVPFFITLISPPWR